MQLTRSFPFLLPDRLPGGMYLYFIKINNIICFGRYLDTLFLFFRSILHRYFMNIISQPFPVFLTGLFLLRRQGGIYHYAGHLFIHPENPLRIPARLLLLCQPFFLFPSGFQLFSSYPGAFLTHSCILTGRLIYLPAPDFTPPTKDFSVISTRHIIDSTITRSTAPTMPRK